MFKAKLIVNNETGIHARPASELVVCCQKFQSEIIIITEDDEVDAKSIISILSAGIHKGTEITLQISGADEDIAGEEVVNLINNLVD